MYLECHAKRDRFAKDMAYEMLEYLAKEWLNDAGLVMEDRYHFRKGLAYPHRERFT